MQKCCSVFRDNLLPEMPQKRAVDDEIRTIEGVRPPNWVLFQWSPSGLLVTKTYVTELLNLEKIRPDKLPYGAIIFFVKQNDKL